MVQQNGSAWETGTSDHRKNWRVKLSQNCTKSPSARVTPAMISPASTTTSLSSSWTETWNSLSPFAQPVSRPTISSPTRTPSPPAGQVREHVNNIIYLLTFFSNFPQLFYSQCVWWLLQVFFFSECPLVTVFKIWPFSFNLCPLVNRLWFVVYRGERKWRLAEGEHDDHSQEEVQWRVQASHGEAPGGRYTGSDPDVR